MKKLNKVLSVGLSLVLCASMVAPAFAASFTDLQNAIDSKSDKKTNRFTADDGTTRYGYGTKVENTWEIEAWNDDDGSRNVQLNADVERVDKDKGGITITAKKAQDVTIDLNGNDIDGKGQSGSVITVDKGTALTVKDSTATTTEDGDYISGKITGGTGTEFTVRAFPGFTEGGTYTAGGGVYVNGSNSSFTLDSGEISGNTATTGGGVQAYNGTVTMNGGKISGNTVNELDVPNVAGANGAGIMMNGGTFTMTDGEISGNISEGMGGGVTIGAASTKFEMSGGKISGNKAGTYGGGLANYGTAVVTGGEINNNNSKLGGDDVDSLPGSKITLPDAASMGATLEEDGKAITGWYHDLGSNSDAGWGGNGKNPYYNYGSTIDRTGSLYLKAAHDQYFTVSYTDGVGEDGVGTSYEDHDLVKGSDIPAAPDNPVRKGYTFGGWKLLDGSDFDPTATVTSNITVVAQWREVSDPVTGDNTVEIGDVNVPLGNLPEDAATMIDDGAVPLAGLFTRADAIGYLWEQSGSPEWELSDFEDVPEDHYWAVAIGWAQDMGIAVADEDGNFRPDDLVLRSVESLEISPEGELQEFLNRYAVFAGIELDADELFIELEGSWDDVIMGEDAQVIFDDFFVRLEEALADLAA